jgi:hypothetical protein
MKLRYRSSSQIQRSELKYKVGDYSQPPITADSRIARRLKKKGKGKRLVEMYVADTKRK